MNKQEKKQFDLAVAKVMEVYGLERTSVDELIRLTNKNSGVSFVSIKEYNSDKSLNTEVANQVININASYENMLDKDAVTLNAEVNVILNKALPLVNDWNYSGVDLQGVPLATFKAQVKEQMPIALGEMKAPKKERVSNDIELNKALKFNLTTMRLSVFGTTISKTVKQEGVYKLVKSKPITIAKRIIEKALETRTSHIRRFTLDNLKGIKLYGETLELGGGQVGGVEITS